MTKTRRLADWPAIGLAVAVLFFFNPDRHGFFPKCPFHQITGLNCPGCGATRALHEVLHGRVTPALRDNALLVVSLPWIAWWAFQFVVRRRRGEPALPAIQTGWLWVLLAVMAVFTVLRNLPVCAWLSP